ncbi:MAG: tetratricopeptide repeat protein [Chloracidobacterium sp.]|nr:tetratricopeptide repeat protein [Chloracidobacterium sp.]
MREKDKNKVEPKNNLVLEANGDRIVLGLIVLCFLAFAIHHIVAYDVWWQLKAGQLVRQTGFPTTDPFSYAFPGQIWTEVRWFYCVVISLIYEWLGPDSLIAAKVVLLSIGGFCLWLFGRQEARWAVNIGLLSALILMHQRLMIRPELVSYVLLAVYLLLIRRFQTTGKSHWLFALPLLQIIWVNSHSIYILGPVVLWLFAGAEVVDKMMGRQQADGEAASSGNVKWLILISVATSLACLVNPYGINGALFAFELFREMQSDNALSGLITELRGPFANPALTLAFVSYLVVIAISAYGFVLRRRTLPLGWFLLWAAFFYLSIMAERNNALFGIVAGASIMVNFGGLSVRSRLVWMVRGVCALFLVVMVPLIVSNYYYRTIDPDRRFGFGVAERRVPIKAMEFVESQGLPKPVITGMGASSYVLFKDGPKSVYIDGRLEVYGPSAIAEGVKIFSTGEGLLDTVSRLNIFTLIGHIENDNVLVQRLINDPAWSTVYYDDSHIIFVRNDPSMQEIVQRLKMNWTDPKPITVETPPHFRSNQFLTRVFPSVGESGPARTLGRLYLLAGNTQLAQTSFEEAIRQWPDDPQVTFPLGVMYRAQKREAEAKKLLAKVPDEMYKQHNNMVFAGTVYESNNNWQAATDAWLQVADLGDKSFEVYQHVAQAAVKAERWDAAFTAFDAMIKIKPNDVGLLNNFGAVAERLDKRQEGSAALTKSLQLNPAQADVATQLGIIKLKQGDVNGARQAFEQAVSADPSFEPAIRQMEKLRAAQAPK